jgi:hypothetical protein
MRLWHLLMAVFFAALVLMIARAEVGRVALVVFFTGLGEVVLGTTALMQLFRTIGAFGAARDFLAHVEALAATALVLILATASMNAVLWVGVALLDRILNSLP